MENEHVTEATPGNIGRLVHEAIPGDRRLTAEALQQIPRVGGPRTSPSGERIVAPVTTWISLAEQGAKRQSLTRLWLLDSKDGEVRPLTDETVSAGVPNWSPDGRQLVCTLNHLAEKKAKPQLFLLNPDEGGSEQLTDLPLGVMDARWLPDGSGLVVVSKVIKEHATIDATRDELKRREEDPVNVRATEQRLFRFWDQWLTDGEMPHFFHFDLTTRECRDITPGLVGWLDFMSPAGQFDIAPDGNEIAIAALVIDEERNDVVSQIFRVPIDGGESAIECLTLDAPGNCQRPRYTPDGATIVYGRREERYFYADRPRLWRYDLDTSEHLPWCTDWDQSPSQWEFKKDGTLFFVAEHEARTHLYELNPDEATPRLLTRGGSLGSPVIGKDDCFFFTRHSLQRPAEVFRCEADGQGTRRVTRFTKESLAGIAMGEVREIEFTGAEGATVQSFVLLPPGHDSSSPAPFVNVIHGGPHGIWGDEFHFRWNSHLFAAPGYVVALPNFQGSTSWGNDFARRIQGEWHHRPYGDVMAVTDYLIECGLVDESRMAAAGGSYGGYLVSWIAGHTNRFRCLVNHAGVYNTLAMYASDATFGRGQSFGGNPWDGLEAIDLCNPARFSADMETPMLVIHGEKDYRVPVTNGLQCYGVLKAKQVPTRLVHFPDENHWILNPDNSIRWYEEVHEWLARWL